MEIPVQIGSIRETFHIFETTAPERYDGGGTFTVHKYDESPKAVHRVIAVPTGTVEWQRGRNSSGMYGMLPIEHESAMFNYLDERTVVNELFKRLAIEPKEA